MYSSNEKEEDYVGTPILIKKGDHLTVEYMIIRKCNYCKKTLEPGTSFYQCVHLHSLNIQGDEYLDVCEDCWSCNPKHVKHTDYIE